MDLPPTPRSAARAARLGVLDEETATAAGAAGAVDPTRDGLTSVRRRFRRKFRLKRFLHEYRLDRYLAALEEEGFDDPEALVKMDDTDMATLGVRMGERHVLKTALEALRGRMERAGWPVEYLQPDQPTAAGYDPRPQRRLSITATEDENLRIEEIRAADARAAEEDTLEEERVDDRAAAKRGVEDDEEEGEAMGPMDDPWGDSYGEPGALARGWRERRMSAAAEFRKAQLERAMASGVTNGVPDDPTRRPPTGEPPLERESMSRLSGQRPNSGYSAWPPTIPWMERGGLDSRGQSREVPSRGGLSQMGDVTQEVDREIVVDVLFEGCVSENVSRASLFAC